MIDIQKEAIAANQKISKSLQDVNTLTDAFRRYLESVNRLIDLYKRHKERDDFEEAARLRDLMNKK